MNGMFTNTVLIHKKGMIFQLIPISKAEAKAVRENFPHIHIVRTMKQKSKRGHYYCEENPRALAFIRNMRNEHVILNRKGGNKNRDNKTRR